MRSTFVLAALAGLMIAGAAPAQTAPDPSFAPPPVEPQNVLNLDLSTGGRVKIQLRPDKAPLSVERIKVLVRRHFYDGLTFHRVIDGFMAQGGDPKGTGEGGSDLPDLKGEFNDMPHVRGVMAMARAESPDSANSQFFIMLQPNLALDGNYTAIGRVMSGMEYVDAIEKGEPPANPSKIVHASIQSDDDGLPATSPTTAAAAAAVAAPTTTVAAPVDKKAEAAERKAAKKKLANTSQNTDAAVKAVSGDEGVSTPH